MKRLLTTVSFLFLTLSSVMAWPWDTLPYVVYSGGFSNFASNYDMDLTESEKYIIEYSEFNRKVIAFYPNDNLESRYPVIPIEGKVVFVNDSIMIATRKAEDKYELLSMHIPTRDGQVIYTFEDEEENLKSVFYDEIDSMYYITYYNGLFRVDINGEMKGKSYWEIPDSAHRMNIVDVDFECTDNITINIEYEYQDNPNNFWKVTKEKYTYILSKEDLSITRIIEDAHTVTYTADCSKYAMYHESGINKGMVSVNDAFSNEILSLLDHGEYYVNDIEFSSDNAFIATNGIHFHYWDIEKQSSLVKTLYFIDHNFGVLQYKNFVELTSDDKYAYAVYTGYLAKIDLESAIDYHSDVPMVSGYDLYPNPSRGNLVIKGAHDIVDIDIFDLTGKLVFSYKNAQKTETLLIDLNHLTTGHYSLLLNQASEPIYEKLIIIE